jgi:hypothetical protein
MTATSVRLPILACACLTPVVFAGCTTLPAGPSLAALPGSRKTVDQFYVDDAQCRNVAIAQIGGRTPSDAANESAAASAAAGTALGAATGALIDGSSGAAAGAGIGLLFGAMAGAGTSESAYAATQQRYDGAYYSCMYALGHKVPIPAAFARQYRARYDGAPARAPAPPPPPSLPPPDAPPPSR